MGAFRRYNSQTGQWDILPGGPTGFTGSSGSAGANGFTGSAGSAGTTGFAGSAGFTGSVGAGGGVTYTVTNNGASAYTIAGADDPTLTLVKGATYYFSVSASGHPFWIKTAAVTGTGSAYTSGVTNNGVDSGTVVFTVPFNAPATLYYICQFHGSMVGTINIVDSMQGYTGSAASTVIGYSGSAGGAAIDGNLVVTGNVTVQNTGFFKLPVGTTAQRPASSDSGFMRLNSDTGIIECYFNGGWQTVASIGWSPQNQINSTGMAHSIVNAGGTGLQGQGSTVITNFGNAAPSITPGSVGYTGTNFSTHGGHSGSNSYPMYWAVYLSAAKAVNQLVVYVHGNSWGYFVLEGSNDCGNTGNFATAGTWTPIPFASSNNGFNNQNMGGNGSGRSDGSTITFTYTNNLGYLAYRIKILDSSGPSQALGTFYGGSASYSWQLNRV